MILSYLIYTCASAKILLGMKLCVVAAKWYVVGRDYMLVLYCISHKVEPKFKFLWWITLILLQISQGERRSFKIVASIERVFFWPTTSGYYLPFFCMLLLSTIWSVSKLNLWGFAVKVDPIDKSSRAQLEPNQEESFLVEFGYGKHCWCQFFEK